MRRIKTILRLQTITISLQIKIQQKYMNNRMRKKSLALLLCSKTKQGKGLKTGSIVLPTLAQELISKMS